MATDVEIERALATLTATMNDQNLEHFDRDRVQQIATRALGGQPLLSVDDGGGIHDSSGARVGAIRRIGSGEWVAERQNDAAAHSDTAIPSAPGESAVQRAITKLKEIGG